MPHVHLMEVRVNDRSNKHIAMLIDALQKQLRSYYIENKTLRDCKPPPRDPDRNLDHLWGGGGVVD